MRAVWTFLGVMMLVGLAIKFWPWALGGLVVLWFCRHAHFERYEEPEAAKRRELIARADEQHAAIMRGDDHLGVYGQFPPARF